MQQIRRKLPEAELEVMLALWEAGGPVQRSYFDARLGARRQWTDSTILSLLARLQEKGFLQAEKRGRCNVYTPLVSKEEYLAVENRSFLGRLYSNSVSRMVASMAQTQNFTKEDLDDLQRLLDELKQGGEA